MAANINDKLKSTWNNEAPAPTTATAVRAPGAETLACQSLNWPTDTAIDFATFGKNADGSVNQASVQEGTAIVSGNNLTSIVITSGGADQGNNIGDIVVMKPTSKGHQDLVDAVKTVLNQDGSLKNGIVTTSKIANGAVTSDTLAQSAVKGENINFPSFVRRQNNTTNVIEVGNLMIQMGWGYIQGSGTTSKEEKPVTFPQAFSAEPILVVSTPGSSSSVPVKISDLNTSGAGGTATSGQRDANARNVTTTGFDAVVSDRGALSTGVYVGFSWIAIGPA